MVIRVDENDKVTRKCSICGEEGVGTYSICPRCNWTNDPYADQNPDGIGIGLTTLNKAKKLYERYGDSWFDHLENEEV